MAAFSGVSPQSASSAPLLSSPTTLVSSVPFPPLSPLPPLPPWPPLSLPPSSSLSLPAPSASFPSPASAAPLLSFPASSASSVLPLFSSPTISALPSPPSPLVSSVPPLTSLTSAYPAYIPTQSPPTLQPSPSLSSPSASAPLYSPSHPFSPHSLYALPPVSSIAADLIHLRKLHMVHEATIQSLLTHISEQNTFFKQLCARDMERDIQIRTQMERISSQDDEISALRSLLQEHVSTCDTRIQALDVAPPVAVEERLTTLQSEVQRQAECQAEWVEVVRRAPAQRATVSETVAETRRRTQRALNIRIRGIERVASASPMQQAVDFVTQTMGVQDHGVESAYRAGRDPARHQPLIIRFRDAQARLTILRRRGCLREYPQVHMDEDLTPLQWHEHRTLLAQRQVARAEGKWAVIRDGRLVTGTLRARAMGQTGPAPGPASQTGPGHP